MIAPKQRSLGAGKPLEQFGHRNARIDRMRHIHSYRVTRRRQKIKRTGRELGNGDDPAPRGVRFRLGAILQYSTLPPASLREALRARPSLRVAEFEHEDSDSTELAEVLPDVAFAVEGRELCGQRSRDDEGRGRDVTPGAYLLDDAPDSTAKGRCSMASF